ncbi:MAG: helix-turn-helix domain-containing protein [Candidatus Methanoperedens sp.]|nr:helix-turn-helix domain-containing protein [Candidatus Methanoperedens sp.]
MTPDTSTSKKEICPVVESIYTIGNKWSLVITYNLMKSPKRFNELKACIPGMSSKVLTQNLSELQKNGIIEKKTNLDQPEKTEYVLTKKGEDLRKLMQEVKAWGERWLISPEQQQPESCHGSEQISELLILPVQAV